MHLFLYVDSSIGSAPSADAFFCHHHLFMEGIMQGLRPLVRKGRRGWAWAASSLYPPTLRYRSWIVSIVIGVLCLFTQPRLAAAMSATAASAGEQEPPLPIASWVALADGAQHWYAFHDDGANRALDGGAITVRMTVLPDQGATFAILTPEQVRWWLHGEELMTVGAGTKDALFPNDFSWTGSFVQSGTYCVLVKSTGHGLSNYKLTISGQGLSFPWPRARFTYSPSDCFGDSQQPPLAQPTLPPTSTTASTNSSPEHPLLPVGKTLPIAVGEHQWYHFRDEGDAASIQVTADATPHNCLTFQIWTPEQLQRWQRNEKFIPVGQGTPNTVLKADLFWTGSFVKSGLYYVVVERDRAVPGDCTYKLWVTGHDVSLPNPTPSK
jgi:hypothetical protein